MSGWLANDQEAWAAIDILGRTNTTRKRGNRGRPMSPEAAGAEVTVTGGTFTASLAGTSVTTFVGK